MPELSYAPSGVFSECDNQCCSAADDISVSGEEKVSCDLVNTADNIDSDPCCYLNVATCPDCGAGMVRLGVCFSCPSCGWGSCG